MRLLCLLILPLLLASCSARAGTRVNRDQRTALLAEEMQAAGYSDALTTVQSLRPNWLRKRGASSITTVETIKVYLDDSLLGGPETLQQITIRSIASIRYFDGLEATQRWGLDHGQGAIVVSTRRSR
jgi:hypothetical protein